MEIFGRGVTGTTDQPRSASDEIDLYQLDKTIELLTFRGAFRETRVFSIGCSMMLSGSDHFALVLQITRVGAELGSSETVSCSSGMLCAYSLCGTKADCGLFVRPANWGIDDTIGVEPRTFFDVAVVESAS